MASRVKKGNGWKVSCSLESNNRIEIFLRKEYSELQVKQFEKLLRSLAKSKRFGTSLLPIELQEIESLPS
ncbi:MAG: hypothetical protein LBH59_08625, partial [Planctomycetaceae bacterium]|nr:hypothetical protein [Planctomycetaceae bacterium]